VSTPQAIDIDVTVGPELRGAGDERI
jgi:hypothetical protein